MSKTLNPKSKPNLGDGVNIKKISSEKRNRKSYAEPRMPVKRQLKGIKNPNHDKVGSTDDIYNIWGRRKNISTFDKGKNKGMRSLWIIIFILLAVAIVSYLGWNFFNNFKPLSGNGVVLEISGEDSVISGHKVGLTIKYENKEQVKVKNVELRINYPEGVYYVSSSKEPDNLGANLWKIGDLDPGEDGKINLDIQVIGNTNDELNIESAIAYEPVNFSSNFETKVSHTIKIEKTLMELSIDSPSEIGNNNRVAYKILYKNISDNNLLNARIRFEYPSGFSVSEVNADSLEQISENTWNLGDLQKKSSGEIKVSGFLDLANNTTSTFNAIIEIKSLYSIEHNLENDLVLEWIPYIKVSKDTLSVPSDVPLQISINNNPIDAVVNWGDELKYELHYKNNSEDAITNIVINLKLDSKYLDKETLQDNFNGDFNEDNLSITWDKNSIPSLAKLAKNQEGKINISIKLHQFDDEYIGSTDYLVKSEAKLKYKNASSEEKEVLSNTIINKLNSPIEASSKVRYYDENGLAVGSGPLPPVVGETTTYEVVWQIKSPTNDLNDVYVKTILPPNVDWGEANVYGKGNMVYNSETREVVWQIKTLEKSKDYTGKFNILLTPEKNHKDKIVTLINQTNISGMESFSEAKISKDFPYLTSELVGDKKASGKERVIDL